MSTFPDLFTPLVDIAPAGGPRQALASLSWVDAGGDVQANDGITATLGQQAGRPSPLAATGTADLTLRNDASGGKTAGRWSSQRLYTPIRCRVRYPATTSGNYAPAAGASFEDGSTGGWTGALFGYAASTIANSAVRAQDGTKSLLITWATSASSAAGIFVGGLTAGRTYTASIYVYVPAGAPAVTLYVFGLATGTSSLAAAFTRLTVTFTATASTHFVFVAATSTGAGQQAWVDALMVDDGATAATFTTAAPPLFDLWTGHVTDWGIDWDGAARALAKVSASDILANLSRTTLARLVSEEILSDDPVAYWPLGEAAGAGAAGDISGTLGVPVLVPTILGTGGAGGLGCDFGVGAAPGPDTATVLALTRTNATNGWYLLASGISALTTSFWTAYRLSVRPSTIAAAMTALVIRDPAITSSTVVGTTAAGKATVTVTDPATGVALTLTGTTTLSTTVATDLVVTSNTTGTTVTVTLYVNGSSEASGAYTRWIPVTGDTIAVGGGLGATNLWDGQIADVAVFNGAALPSASIARHHNAAAGFTGETSDLRFDRIARLGGLPTDRYVSAGTGLSTMAPQAIAGVALPEALKAVAEAEFGVVSVDGSGRVTFTERSRRYNASPTLTLDARTHVIGGLGGLNRNDADLLNDVTYSRPDGATQRSVDQASIDVYGAMTDSKTLFLDSDAQVASAAQWASHARSAPQPKAPTLTVSLLTLHYSGLAAAALGLAVGSLVRVTNLPAGAPASSIDLFVEGLRWDMGSADIRLAIYTSAASTSSVWKLDSASYSQLGSTTTLAF